MCFGLTGIRFAVMGQFDKSVLAIILAGVALGSGAVGVSRIRRALASEA